jgi:hypothetical protein
MRQKVDIKIKDCFIDFILDDLKKSTIRKGIRSIYTHDDIVFTSETGRVIEVLCSSVTVTTLDTLTDEDAIMDGFENKKELLEELKKFYPDIRANELVTIIYFRKYSDPDYFDYSKVKRNI